MFVKMIFCWIGFSTMYADVHQKRRILSNPILPYAYQQQERHTMLLKKRPGQKNELHVIKETPKKEEPVPFFLSHPVASRIEKAFKKAQSPYSNGIIYASSGSTCVKAPIDGKITHASFIESLGKVVVIEPYEGGAVLLSGLNSLDIKIGDVVTRGQIIGSVQRASQVYLEIKYKDRYIDPEKILVKASEE
jgi:murein DD-endopeptidase MepM/ murein hydrolase activator NlpD